MGRKILVQGDRDGACFLYAVANAKYALVGRRRKQQKEQVDWDTAVQNIPRSSDFLLGGVGTAGYNSNKEILNIAIDIMLQFYSYGKFKLSAKYAGENFNLRKIDEHISEKSVVIFCYEGNTDNQIDLDHWVCAVDFDSEPYSVKLACSEIFKTEGANYQEWRSNNFNRWYNDSFSLPPKLKIYSETVFKIILEKG